MDAGAPSQKSFTKVNGGSDGCLRHKCSMHGMQSHAVRCCNPVPAHCRVVDDTAGMSISLAGSVGTRRVCSNHRIVWYYGVLDARSIQLLDGGYQRPPLRVLVDMQPIADFVLWVKTEMPVVHEYGACIKVLTVDVDALNGFLGIVIVH